MIEFLETHKQDVIFGVLVIMTMIILRILTNKLLNWIAKEKQRKFPGDPLKSVRLLKRILNTLWIVLGLMALSYLIVDENQQNTLADDFKTVLYIGVVLSFTVIAATTSNIWFKHDIQKKIETEQDPTSFQFLRYIVLVGIYFIGMMLCLLAFPSLKGVAQTALGGAGVLTLIAGLASQEALSNVIGGIFIIVFKPFKVGDLIKVTDTMVGRVSDITLRHTVIRNFENKMIVIPNAIINKEKLINYDMGELKVCERIEIGISYDSDIDLAKKIMQEECENHPLILDNRSEEEIQEGKPIVRTALTQLNDSSMTIRAWTWERSYSDSFQLKVDVLESIKKRFDKEGIEIPFPYRTIVMKKDLEAQVEKETTTK
jgi:small-conductance mechanosensitive channel